MDNVLESFILSIVRFTLLLASPERMEAVAVRWHSSLYPLPPADCFSRGVVGEGGLGRNTQHAGMVAVGVAWRET